MVTSRTRGVNKHPWITVDSFGLRPVSRGKTAVSTLPRPSFPCSLKGGRTPEVKTPPLTPTLI